MSDFIEMPCPQCQRSLRIRKTFVGLRLACKFCQHKFRVDEPAVPVAPTPAVEAAANPADASTSRIECVPIVAVSDDSAARRRSALENLARVEEEVKGLEAELVKARSDANRAGVLQEELDVVRAERDELGAKLRSAEEKLAQLTAQQEAELATLRREADDHRQARAAATSDLDQHRSKTEEFEQTVASLRSEHEEARHASTAAFRDARRVWELERSGLSEAWEKERLQPLQVVEQQLRDECARLTTELQQLREEHDRQVARWQAERDELHGTHDRERSRLVSDHEQWKEERAREEARQAAEHDRLSQQHVAEHARLSTELEQLREQHAQEHSRLLSEHERLKEEHLREKTNGQNELSSLRSELEGARNRAASTADDSNALKARLAELEGQRETLADDARRLQSERDELLEARNQLESGIEALTREADGLRRSDAENQLRSAELVSQIEAVREALTEAERQLAQLRQAPPEKAPHERNGVDHAALEVFARERQELQDELNRQRQEISALKNTLEMLGIVL